IYNNPQHPYTKALMSAIPLPDPEKRTEMQTIKGEIPSNVNTPSGCKFHPRCPFAKEICSQKVPEVKEVKANHKVQCHFAGEFK
ncbi:MAG: ABC transporter ATP-binding protein, partial [Erysipelotrichia bacterium]|nr:ABC transporter ATP-binding protein [Erysipelotrichia bacterium]